MKKYSKIFLLIGLTLAGCQATTPALEPTGEGILSELPATWTVGPSSTPEPTRTKKIKPDLTGTPTPTPDYIPPTPTKESYSFATHTPVTFGELPPLIRGDEVQITHIEMVDSSKGWGIGSQDNEHYYILYTRDGGSSWEDRTPPVQISIRKYSRNDEIFFNQAGKNTAWVLIPDTKDFVVNDNYLVWRTDDGGRTWTTSEPLVFPLTPTYIHPGWLYFIDRNTGWLFAKSEFFQMHDWSFLFATRDGGNNWELVNQLGDSMIESRLNTGIGFANENDGWVTKDDLGGGLGPFIEQSHDGGYTWEYIYLPHPEGGSWEEVIQNCLTIEPVFTESHRGIVLVQCFQYDEENHLFSQENSNTYIYSSNDWGKSWQFSKLPSSADRLFFTDSQTGFAMGGEHYQTVNGGGDWVKIKTVSWDGQFSFIDANEGWAVARLDDQIALLHTSDGGYTYQEIKPIISP
jgi:photosystem II stability/assembly factor-like uncharacterized protein